ncbi:unnamed protein product [Phytophthora fragariaefolia]|uniref:Unnamed protein product n=1 Tax=Phytophthora fragariaefolia TaxID=1490495 RepID=A0A9W6XT82_9STRA|nr:unnamed protein product [Phytophthora fragariaefolia]
MPHTEFVDLSKLSQALVGLLLPGATAPRYHIPSLPVGGVVPRQFFPANHAALRKWGNRQISDLGVLLNDDFGIVGTYGVQKRRVKLQLYLAGAMK